MGLRKLGDEGEHGLVRAENLLPGRNELRFGAAVAQHVENAAEKGSAVDLPVLIAQLDAVDGREHFGLILNFAVLGNSAEREAEVKSKKDVTDIEEECANQSGQG